MDSLITLIFLIALGLGAYYIYRYFAGNKMIATDELYQQRGVTVIYKAGSIKINNHTYNVKQVTGVAVVTQTDQRRNTYFVKIEVDDLRKPVHRIAVIGTKRNADDFIQRICVAIRKAGGPDFH